MVEDSAESSILKPQAWSKQKYLKEEKIPTVGEVIEIITNIPNIKERALLILAYLSAGRIREIVRKKDRSSIKHSDLNIVVEEGRQILIIDLRNEKNNNRKRKEIPVPLDIKENILLWNQLIEYLNTVSKDEELFPFSYQYAYERIVNLTSWNPHWIRHIRLTHLVTFYGYKEYQLIRYAGWTDSRPAKNYIEMNWKDLLY